MSGYTLHTPAAAWSEGTICGNGTIGAVIMGNPAQEQVMLSHEELFAPIFGHEKPIPMAEKLPEIRKLIAEEKYREAGHIPWKMFRKKHEDKLWTNPFLPAGDLVIWTAGVEAYEKYERSLDFETGAAQVRFEQNGVQYGRKYLVSREYGKLLVELSAAREAAADGRKEQKTAAAEYHISLRKHPYEEERTCALYDYLNGSLETEARALTYLCHYGDSDEGYRICLEIPEQEGVTCIGVDGVLAVCAKETVLLEVTVEVLQPGTPVHFEEEIQGSLHGTFEDVRRINLLKKIVNSEHRETLSVHEERINRIHLHLQEENSYENDEALYQATRTGKADAAFLNRIFDAGRYAILSSTGKLPPNLQGVWNGTYDVPWSGDYTQDGNLQTAILGMLPCGDFESMQSFVDYQEALMEDYRENCRILYGCRGIHVPTRTSDMGYDIHFDETWPMLFWTAGAGWNARFFYDYWLYTGDDVFFREHALPFMKEAALFYEDYLVEGPDGKWIFTPSYSPENTPKGNDSSVAVNATMDISVARELLTNLISGCRTLGLTKEEENVRKWEQMLEKMPPYLVNGEGALKEWAWESLEDEYDHRHISHLYLLYYDIPKDVRENEALFEACRKAYEIKMEQKKKEKGTMAFGLIQAGMVAAHLQDADMTETMLQSMACNDYYPTFASSHDYGPNLFNTDISGGLPALMLECIAQSFPILADDYSIDHYEIRLLPALPESMKSGEVRGLCLRGGFRLNMSWKDGAVTEYELENLLGRKYTLFI